MKPFASLIKGKNRLKGVLANAYGVYADPIPPALAAKLTIHPFAN